MEYKPILKISVRNLVECTLRSGDLTTGGFTKSSRLIEGIRIHGIVQKSKPEGYLSEVPVSYLVEGKCINLEVSGRIDGILQTDDFTVIEEIKSTSDALENIEKDYNNLHWAQAKCYAFIYAVQNNLESIVIQLTYCQVDSEEVKSFREKLDIGELTGFFNGVVGKYLQWAEKEQQRVLIRDQSISRLKFPFNSFRKGQRELTVAAYKTIKEGKKLFAQAPTGIGKTIATLFPAVKAMGEGSVTKIFYLTAKTITRTIAENALDKLRESGLIIKTLTITAKEKICLNYEAVCDPMYCEFASGYYDKIESALNDVYHIDNFSRQVIEDYALKHKVCPFEFSLDLSLLADCIVCDYNYVFDPRVYLKRFFMDGGGDYAFLVDEAHNLVDRARDMFSAELQKQRFIQLKKIVKSQDRNLYKILNKINAYMLDVKKECDYEEKGFMVKTGEPEELYPLLEDFVRKAEMLLDKNYEFDGKDNFLELYFDIMTFLKIAEFYDDNYVTYFENDKNGIKVKLFCLDPSFLLRKAIKRGKSAVFFSATLTPTSYFRSLLGGDEDSYSMRLSSPFYRENLCLLIADRISTKYKNREKSYMVVAEYIKALVRQKKGNYIVYFPSYKYMHDVVVSFSDINEDAEIIVQSTSMSEKDREEFLERFQPDPVKTLVGFGVLGGIFSEGVDLKGERLVGAVIVGVGLPQLSLEQDIIMNYFNGKNNNGYEYAYMFPGMNKVMQAAGRVIRSEEDRGAVLLIDERFSHERYQELFPEEWCHNIKVKSASDLANCVRKFWDR